MDSWILGLRADEDVQLEFRALLGPSVRSVGHVEVHAFEASSHAFAARLIDELAQSLGYGVAALTPDEPAVIEQGIETLPATERVTALCLSAAPGEFLLALRAARSFAASMCLSRAKNRPGWRLPMSCAALSDAPRLRSDCRSAAATLPEHPAFTGREDELESLITALSRAEPGQRPFAVVRASHGMGATRLLHEAAARADARLARLVVDGDAVSAEHIASELDVQGSAGRRWLLVESRDPSRSLAIDLTAPPGCAPDAAVVVTVAPDCDTPWCPHDREIELGPLAPAESRALVRGLLGDLTEDMLVARFARRSGVPGELVMLVRSAAITGEVVRDARPDGALWRPRNRRLVAIGRRESGGSARQRHLDALDPVARRALSVTIALGDGVPEHALRGVLRMVLGGADHVASLRAHGMLTLTGGAVDLGRNAGLVDAPDAALSGRLASLRRVGVVDALVDAERALDARSPEAPVLFALAAMAAMATGDRAAAIRLLAVAAPLPRPAGDESVDSAVRAVASELGAVATITPLASARPSATTSVTPEVLEEAAAARDERGEPRAARRLSALAALLKGDASLALHVGDTGSTVRDHLLGAIAHARESHIPDAVRSAVAALALARREGDAGGEAATMALLSSLYAAAGRPDDAARFSAALPAHGA